MPKKKKIGRPKFGVKRFYKKRVEKLSSTFSVSEAARILNVAISSVSYWTKNGLPSGKGLRERWLKKSELKKFLKETGRMMPKRKEY